MAGGEHYNYTQRMEKLVSENVNSAAALYSREDLAEARSNVLTAEKSTVLINRVALKRMCDAAGIDMERLLADEGELMKLPARREMKTELAGILYALYREFPTSVDYMRRLVSWLAPEYEGEPLRLAILKKFLRGSVHEGAMFSAESLYEWAEARLSGDERAHSEQLCGVERKKCLIEQLTDDVFELMEVQLSPAEMLALMAKRLRRSLNGTDGCFVRNEDGSKGVVTDLCVSGETAAAMRAFLEKHMPGEYQPMKMLDCLDCIVQLCGKEPRREADIEPFYDMLYRDFRAQLSGIGYVRRDAEKILAAKGEAFADECVKICMDPKYGVRTDRAQLECMFAARWEAHRERIAAICALPEAAEEEFAADMLRWIQDAVACGSIDANCPEKSWRAMIGRLHRAFIKHAKQAASAMNDPLQEKFKTDRKDALKGKKKRFRVDPVLEICDDLAKGLFRKNGISKENLYYFAFMFDMQVSIDGRMIDPKRDMVKNLFQDYYADNLTRYLQAEYQDPSLLTNLEKEPTGEGINYKNYVEAIYLYYLCNESFGEGGVRLDRAVKMIDRCKKCGQRENKRGIVHDVSGATRVYRYDRMQELLRLPEERVEEFICSHYLIVPPAAVAQIMVNAEEMTAVENVRQIMEELEAAFDSNAMIEREAIRDRLGRKVLYVGKDDNWDAIKRDNVYAKNMKFSWELSEQLRRQFGGDADFMRIVDALEKRLDTEKYPGLVAEMYSNPLAGSSKRDGKKYALIEAEQEGRHNGRITRSGLIALYANYYKTMLDDMQGSAAEIGNLAELYEDFCSTINPTLEECRYQPISMKNLLDVYTVYTLGCYLLDRLG